VTSAKVSRAINECVSVYGIERLLFVDIDENALRSIPEDQRALLAGTSEIVELLGTRGFLGEDVLVLICTPSVYHVAYAELLDGLVGHIAIEKPIALRSDEAERLLRLSAAVTPIEHQVYKADMMRLCQRSRIGELDWQRVRAIQFKLHETGGVGERAIDDIVFDTGYHGLACMLAAASQAHSDLQIEIKSCRSKTYRLGPDAPQKCTAAFIRGMLRNRAFSIPFEVSVGKGFEASDKSLRLQIDRGVVEMVSLNESGHLAHKRVLDSIVNNEPALLGVEESIRIVRSCERALAIEEHTGTYRFGQTPNWQAIFPNLVSRTSQIASRVKSFVW
jgi:hypothetical protein